MDDWMAAWRAGRSAVWMAAESVVSKAKRLAAHSGANSVAWKAVKMAKSWADQSELNLVVLSGLSLAGNWD